MEITAKSSTDAMEMKRLLRKHGVRASLGKRSDENGCYFYLTISDKKYPEAESVLERYR